MFVFHRSLIAVLAPIALLMAVVIWSSQDSRAVAVPAASAQHAVGAQGQVARVNPVRDGDS